MKEVHVSVRKRFRALVAAPRLLVSGGVYDAFSARLAERAGFEALTAGGNACIGGLLAAPDLGQTNMRDMADLYARICASVDVPVMVDADTGYGGVHNVHQAVREFENAGVAGLTINDQTFPNRCGYLPGKSLVSIEEMLAKIKAAVDARRDSEMVIVARTDAANIEGLDAALDRCHLFLEAGADIAKPQCVDDERDVVRIVRELGCPYLATLSSAAGDLPLDIGDLGRLGAAAVSLPGLGIFAAMMGLNEIMTAIQSGDSWRDVRGKLPTLAEYYDTVGLADHSGRETTYEAFARSLIQVTEVPGRHR